MTTIDDKATEREEQFRDIALREREACARRSRMQPTGCCRCCGEEEMEPGALFCCRECRDDYDAMLKIRRITGG